MQQDDDFPQIKRDLINEIVQIKGYITTSNALLEDIQARLWGDASQNPPVVGHEQRIERLEKIEISRAKTRDAILKTAIGSVTFAVGSIVVWMFGALREALTRGR